ncbi:MAG: S8 family peptidase [Caldilineaceae bacterium]
MLQQIQGNPRAIIKVIIQKNNNGSDLEQLIRQLDGKITKDLSIIHAIAAELPAKNISKIAQNRAVRWISPDAPVVETGCKQCVSTANLKNSYNQTVYASRVWNTPPYLQGKGVTVAVVDSGMNTAHADIKDRVIAEKSFRLKSGTGDSFGHGTFVAGIIAGTGAAGNGTYIGIAPKANLLNVKVSGSLGEALESDVIAGLQWIYEQKSTYKIRVVNLSINSAVEQSYHKSPLAAACEILWFNGIVVVASSGNNGSGKLYPPANDPFVITVGAIDEMGTATIVDDSVPAFSAFGITKDGFAKPDLVAPGRYIVGPLASSKSTLALLHRSNIVAQNYFMMSGTSVSAPIVSGAVALLLEDEPSLTPDQVKYRLVSTANKNWRAYNAAQAGAGELDVYAAIQSNTTKSANTGTLVSNLLTTGPESILSSQSKWANTSWNSVSWSSVSWSSVSWSSVSWSSASWSSDYWEDGKNGPIEDLIKEESLDLTIFESSVDQENKPEGETSKNSVFLPLVTSN